MINPVVIPVQLATASKKSDESYFPNKVDCFAKRVFAELAFALTLNAAVSLFFAVPISISGMSLIALAALSGVAVRMYFESQFGESNDDFDALMPPVGEVVGRLSLVNTIGLSSINIWIHEAGHAIGAALCFLKPNIKMHWKPFVHGDTSFTVSHGMTQLGNYLGKHDAILLCRAGGLIASTAFALSEIAVAFFIRKEHPQTSLTLNCHAVSQIANDFIHGLYALNTRGFNISNDYLALWRTGGIHPAIPMVLMVALPIIEYSALHYFSS